MTQHPDAREVSAILGVLAGSWVLLILHKLATGAKRHGELLDAIVRISEKVLTEALRRMERDGLVTRHRDHGPVETATLYQFTDVGKSLGEPLTAVTDKRSTERGGCDMSHYS